MDYEESRLPYKYPEFRYIYQEYHDGILLFDIMDQKVWSKAVSDTIGLVSFHKENRNNYMWEKRAEALLITCNEGVDVSQVRKAHKKILKGKLDEADLNGIHCSNDTVPCITVTSLLVEKGENEQVDAQWDTPGLGPVTEEEGTSSFVILKKVRGPEPKALNEARGQITSDYQNYLEKEWIEELKQSYPVEVNRNLLSRIE
jgi:peptidyl-prolyl cis-trans isomerase SurA